MPFSSRQGEQHFLASNSKEGWLYGCMAFVGEIERRQVNTKAVMEAGREKNCASEEDNIAVDQ